MEHEENLHYIFVRQDHPEALKIFQVFQTAFQIRFYFGQCSLGSAFKESKAKTVGHGLGQVKGFPIINKVLRQDLLHFFEGYIGVKSIFLKKLNEKMTLMTSANSVSWANKLKNRVSKI